MNGRLPNFLIAGAAKCGTTSLAAWLSAHPQAFVPPSKELAFFELDEIFRRGPGWYAQQFEDAGDALAVGEATPSYMFYPWSVERIEQLVPNVRIVVCLRNPADRAYSHYLHWRDRLMLEPRTFARAMDDELAAGGTEVAQHRPRGKPPYFAYLARGLFLAQLERLAGAFGPERVHVVLLDDLRADSAAAYAGVCRFLEIDDDFVPETLGGSENPYQRHRRDWLVRPLVRARVMQRLPNPMAEFIVRHVFPPVAQPVPPPDPEARHRLVEFFAPHNDALGAWLGRDLSSWNDGEPVAMQAAAALSATRAA